MAALTELFNEVSADATALAWEPTSLSTTEAKVPNELWMELREAARGAAKAPRVLFKPATVFTPVWRSWASCTNQCQLGLITPSVLGNIISP